MTQAEDERAAEEYWEKNQVTSPQLVCEVSELQIKAFLAGAEHARAKWIKCSERMPKPHSDVLVCELVGDEVVMSVSNWWQEVILGAVGEIIITHWVDDGEPSYWMPLPSAPEGERK